MKKLLITSAFLSFVFVPSAFATDDVSVPYSPSLSSVYASVENKEEIAVTLNKLSYAKKRGNKLTEERVTSLNSNKEAIENNKKLTAEQKAALTAVLATNVSNLTSLRSSIDTSSSATATKVLIDSIFKDFRIYGIVIPKVRLDARIYQLKNHSTKLSETFSKLQSKIDEQKVKGNDVTSWQKGLDDAKMLVAQDMFTLEEMLKKTATLAPGNYGTTSKAIIESINKDIKIVSKDFNTIVSKVRKPEHMKKRQGESSSVATTTTGMVR